MVDEFRTIRDNLFKALTGRDRDEGQEGDDEGGGPEGLGGFGGLDAGAARALLGALFARAGKGKDEVVQIVAREIGLAVAAMLKEPLAALAKHQKLQISFEFVPKSGHEAEADGDANERRAAPPAKGRPPTPTKRSSRRRKSDR
jgi:hypothetical protein